MGKYHYNEDNLKPTELFLACIANELAEANRLKRIEIKAQYGYCSKNEIPNDLGDRA